MGIWVFTIRHPVREVLMEFTAGFWILCSVILRQFGDPGIGGQVLKAATKTVAEVAAPTNVKTSAILKTATLDKTALNKVASSPTYCIKGGVTSSDLELYPCLYVANVKATWLDALNDCEQNGGTLAKIETWTQQSYIRKHQSNNDTTWFGLSDITVDEQFKWTDKSDLKWTNWIYKVPKVDTNLNCAAISGLYSWESQNCADTNYYVCQFSLTAAPVENVFQAKSSSLSDKEAQLQKPDTFSGIELMSRVVAEDESLCVLHCLYNPLCTTMAYGPLKSPYNCLLYKAYAQGYAPLWQGWNMYTVV